MAYTKQVWTNDSGLAISKDSLGHMEDGIATAQSTAENAATTGTTNLTTTRTATAVNVNSDTGTDATLAAADATNAGVMTAAMQAKLAGIANNATANSSDAVLLARANQTGTQDVSTIDAVSLAEVIRDTIAAALMEGTNVTITRDDANDTITISATGGGGVGTTNLTFTRTATTVSVNSDTGTDVVLPAADGASAGMMTASDKNKLAGISPNATNNESNSFLLDRANHIGQQAISTVINLQSTLDSKAGGAGLTIWKGTAAAYSGLGSYDNNTIYFVKG